MPPSNSPFAYEDIRSALQRALDSKKGIKIKAATHGAAVGLRHRFNNYRRFDARQNAKLYAEDHPMHNRCPFDVLRLRIPKKGEPDDNVLSIEKRGIEDFNFEEIMDEPVEAAVETKGMSEDGIDEEVDQDGSGQCKSCGRFFAPPVSQCPTCAEPLKFGATTT